MAAVFLRGASARLKRPKRAPCCRCGAGMFARDFCQIRFPHACQCGLQCGVHMRVHMLQSGPWARRPAGLPPHRIGMRICLYPSLRVFLRVSLCIFWDRRRLVRGGIDSLQQGTCCHWGFKCGHLIALADMSIAALGALFCQNLRRRGRERWALDGALKCLGSHLRMALTVRRRLRSHRLRRRRLGRRV